MTQVIMKTDALSLTLQLFPLSPEAVRRLRRTDDGIDTQVIIPFTHK